MSDQIVPLRIGSEWITSRQVSQTTQVFNPLNRPNHRHRTGRLRR